MAYELSYLMWYNFFTINPLLTSSVFLRFLVELSLFCYIPIVTFSSNFSHNAFRLYIFLIVCNILTLLSYSFYYTTSILDLNFSLFTSWYIIVSKLLVLAIFCIILCIIKRKVLFDSSYVSEFCAILNFLLLFILLLLSSYDFMLMYTLIEGISLCLYILGSFVSLNLISIEGIIKYFLLNSVVSNVMLLGISLIFGLVGSLDFIDIQIFLGGISNFELFFESLYLIFFFSLFGFFF